MKLTVAIQSAGIFLINVLFILATRNFKSSALKYWSAAWTALSLSLVSCLIGYSLFYDFGFKIIARIFFLIYNFGEYVFLFLLVTGCRNFSSNYTPPKKLRLILIPAALTALGLSLINDSPQNPVYLHGAILAAGFFLSFYSLKSLKQKEQRNLGLDTMRFSLLLLGVDFMIMSFPWDFVLPFFLDSVWIQYKNIESVSDLIFEIFLGFGMMMAMLERMRDVEKTNQELKISQNRLEQEINIDPLTKVFNRHAFHSFLYKKEQEKAEASGCVGVFDINNLKPINDDFGHKAGDSAIRAVAHSIRNLTRADDLLVRWGGDEFLLIMLGLDEPDAQNRMDSLNETLKNVLLDDLKGPMSIEVSYGFAGFSKVSELEKAIEVADFIMYGNKRACKNAQTFIANPAANSLLRIHSGTDFIN